MFIADYYNPMSIIDIEKQPMLTAPRDGSSIGLYVGSGLRVMWIAVFFDTNYGIWREDTIERKAVVAMPRYWCTKSDLEAHCAKFGINAPLSTIEYPTISLTLRNTIEEISRHSNSWIKLLTTYADSLPPDISPTPEDSDGIADKSYALHELEAMKSTLSLLIRAACG